MSSKIEEKGPFGVIKYKDEEEMQEWDKVINQQVAVISKNRTEAEAFARDAVHSLFISERNMATLRNQNILQRIWGSLTGGNQRLRDEAKSNLAKSQHNTLKLLTKLGEQDVLLMDSILTVFSYAKYIATENKKLKEILIDNFRAIKNRFERNEENIKDLTSRIKSLEESHDKLVDDYRVTQWRSGVIGDNYDELPKVERLFKMVYDFSQAKSSYWTSKDFIQFRAAMLDCGFTKHESIKIRYLIEEMINNLNREKAINIKQRLSLNYVKDSKDLVSLPLLYAINETLNIYEESSKYEIIRTIINKVKRDNKVILDEKEYLLEIALVYLQNYGIDVDAEVDFYELAIDLLNGKKLLESLKQKQEAIQEKTESKQIPIEKLDKKSKIVETQKKNLLEQGEKYLKSRDYEKALAFFQKRSIYKKEIEEIINKYSDSLKKSEDYDTLMEVSRMAIKLNPRNPIPYNYLASAYEAIKKNKDAEKNYKKAISLDSANPKYRYDLGLFYCGKPGKKNAVRNIVRILVNQDFKLAHDLDERAKDSWSNYTSILDDSSET